MKRKFTFFCLCIFIVLLVAGPFRISAQTATTSVTYTGFQACGGCTVCGADYWCFNTPGSYCGNTAACGTSSFIDPVPPEILLPILVWNTGQPTAQAEL